ncbi:MAG: DUF4406 domain-containing protein [Treponema sp.]|nr:DUF4406 domain-containing protein [Treponema sp.]
MKLYLSGKITGFDFFKETFAIARRQLESSGYEVCDPATFELPEGVAWTDAMKYDIQKMLQCDGVATLDNWQDSTGARIEVRLARNLGMPVFSVTKWITQADETPANS